MIRDHMGVPCRNDTNDMFSYLNKNKKARKRLIEHLLIYSRS